MDAWLHEHWLVGNTGDTGLCTPTPTQLSSQRGVQLGALGATQVLAGGVSDAAGVSPLKPQDQTAWSHLSWARVTLLREATCKLWPWAHSRAATPLRSETPPQDTPPVNSGSPDSRFPSFGKIWRKVLGNNRHGGTEAGTSHRGHTQAGRGGWGGRVEPRAAPGRSDTSACGRAHSLEGRSNPRAPEGSCRG